MIDRLLGLASAASLLIGSAAGPAAPEAAVVFTFRDPNIVESSGLVAAGKLFLTTNDSGDGGRVFVVDGEGHTVGTTSWAEEPTDAEALADAGQGSVWVGDTGDNARERESITVLRVPYGRDDLDVTPTAYELVYPDRAHDAETLMADPRSGQLFVLSKDVFGGTLYAAPKELSPDGPNRLTEVGGGPSVATDGSFFPDGRHYVVRGYTSATVYTFPGHEAIGSFRLPDQQQGEGISVGANGAIYLSTEGQHTDLLRMEVPADVAAAMAPAPESTPAPAAGERAEDEPASDGAPWPWLAAGAVFVLGAGWLLLRRGTTS